MPTLVRSVPPGDTTRSFIVADHLDFMQTILQRHLQAKDTRLLPTLLARGGDEVAQIVHLMEAQHSQLKKLCADIQDATSVWLTDGTRESRKVLTNTLDRFLLVLNDHLRTDEELFLPLVGTHLTQAEWAMIAQEASVGIGPADQPLLFGMLKYEGDREVSEHGTRTPAGVNS